MALFDKDQLPSDHVVSTHVLHPYGMDVLDELGIGEAIRAETPGSRVIRFVLDGTVLDVIFRDGRLERCPRRHRLDARLQESARATGAHVFDRSRVVDVLTKEGRVVGLRVKRHGMEYDVSARLIVGADGRHSTIAHCVGASEYLGYDAQRACYWTYWPAPPQWNDKGRYPFDMYVARSGIAFRSIFQTDDDQLLIATSPPTEHAKAWRGDLNTAYRSDVNEDAVIQSLIGDNEPSEPVRGTVKERYYFREATGPGWALVGDAGHHKDFIIADGMTEALRQSQSLSSAIGRGTDTALTAWWRQRDIEALPMFRFAQDQGTPEALPKLITRIYARLARLPDGCMRFSDGFDRRVSPYDSIPLSVMLGAVLDGVLAGELATVRDFIALSQRRTCVAKEVAAVTGEFPSYELTS